MPNTGFCIIIVQVSPLFFPAKKRQVKEAEPMYWSVALKKTCKCLCGVHDTYGLLLGGKELISFHTFFNAPVCLNLIYTNIFQHVLIVILFLKSADLVSKVFMD